MVNGYITLQRKILLWEWYQDTNTKIVFIHLLLKANHTEKAHQGILIERGQFKTGIKKLSYEIGLSEQKIKTSLNKLKLTNEITIKSTNRYSIITLLKYNEYQLDNKQDNQQITSKQISNNNQITTTKNVKKEKNVKNGKKEHYEQYFAHSGLNESFLEFIDLRKKLKAINSDRAIMGLLNKLLVFSVEERILMLNESHIGSWKSVFPLKKENMKKYQQNKNLLPKDVEADWFDDYLKKL